MFFSVIVPVYNVSSYLGICIDSIIQQDFKDYELILVDDGSNDGSETICDKYAAQNSNFSVFHKKNGGLSDARNYGIERANGEYVIFIDSDDWIKENSFSGFYNIISTGKPDILLTDITEYFNSHNYIQKNPSIEDKSIMDKKEAINWLFEKSKTPWPAVTKIVSRKLINDNNLRFVKNRLHEDMDWTCRCALCAKNFSVYGKEWYFHRMSREGSITSTLRVKGIIDIITMAGFIISDIENLNDEYSDIIIQCVLSSVYYSLKCASKLSDKDIEILSECISANENVFSKKTTLKYNIFNIYRKMVGNSKAIKALRILGNR